MASHSTLSFLQCLRALIKEVNFLLLLHQEVDGKPPVIACHVNGPEKGPRANGTEKLFQNFDAARVALFHLLLLLSVGPDTYLAIGTFFTV